MEYSVILIIVAFIGYASSAEEWNYDDKGPSKWADSYEICDDKAQSPINIAADNAEVDKDLGLFNRDWYYTPPTGMRLKNNGHALQMDITGGANTVNDRKFLPFEAELVQYHFHWANTKDGEGSEHTLNGNQYFGELHLVHYNKKYPNITKALEESDGLAVLGFLIKAGYPQDNEAIDQIFDMLALDQVMNVSSSVDIDTEFSVETLIPPNTAVYYRYQGSLTTPPCYESVTWTVFEDPIEISDSQAEKLSLALLENDATGDKIGNNFRPVQDLNGRKVTKPPALVFDSSAASFGPSIILATIPTILALFM